MSGPDSSQDPSRWPGGYPTGNGDPELPLPSRSSQYLSIQPCSTPLCVETQQYEATKTVDDPSRPSNSQISTHQDGGSDGGLTVYDTDKNAYMARAWTSSTYAPSENGEAFYSGPHPPQPIAETAERRQLNAKNLSIAFPDPDERPTALQAFISQGMDAPWPCYEPQVCLLDFESSAIPN
jgi:hypothetical protein